MSWEEIGERIKAIRNSKKLTQAQFGKLIGKTAQYVGRIERGQRMSVDTIAAICKETGAATDYIIFGIDDPSADMDFLDSLSKEQIDLCLDIIRQVAELIKTPNGNALLIKELMRRQFQPV